MTFPRVQFPELNVVSYWIGVGLTANPDVDRREKVEGWSQTTESDMSGPPVAADIFMTSEYLENPELRYGSVFPLGGYALQFRVEEKNIE